MDYQNQYGYGQQAPQQPANNQGTALGWDDEVEEKTFTLLPEGTYPFRVDSFDREQHNGTDKMPPCNVANVHLVINHNGEDVHIDKKLWKFNSVKPGEKQDSRRPAPRAIRFAGAFY